MSFKTVDHSGVLVGDDDDNNLSEWKYQAFSTADTDNEDLDHDQLYTQSSNTWTAQGYFSEEPTILDPNKGCSIYNGGSWYIEGTEAQFEIAYPFMDSNQTNLHSVAHNPDTGESGSFSISIDVGLGPISVGISEALYDGVNLTNDSYEKTIWKFDYGIEGAEIPTSQEDSVGVRWDYEAEGSTGQFTPRVNQSYSFDVVHHCSGPKVVTSETPDTWQVHNIEVVSR